MIITTSSEFRSGLRKYFDAVNNNKEVIVINRGKNRNVVIISLDKYETMLATQEVNATKSNPGDTSSTPGVKRKSKTVYKSLFEE